MCCVDRKSDDVFRRIFGRVDTKDILARFLSLVLEVEILPEELMLLDAITPPKCTEPKPLVLNILAWRSAAHEKLHIELQCVSKENARWRAMYYLTQAIVDDACDENFYLALPKVISILLADSLLFEENDPKEYHEVFHVRSAESNALLTDALAIHVLELARLLEWKLDGDTEALAMWGMYLNNVDGDALEIIAEREPMIRRAIAIEKGGVLNEGF
ncbi:MAG: Rpn family recombination-promoting nuclease/putative transposase [Synergistaceae bacterium]|jgi:predicted transposase/invertase (TIGR01784 family)|nr:Rpn family recombination-promoting nuclease/putative transposase [Synergistaceae bacterium]